MLFLAKEMKAYSHPEKAHLLSPSILAHLSFDTVANATFVDPSQ